MKSILDSARLFEQGQSQEKFISMIVDSRWPPYQNVNAMQGSIILSLAAKTSVEYFDLSKAPLTWAFSRVSYRSQIMFSNVNALTVLKAEIDSAANLELSAKTAWFIAYRVRRPSVLLNSENLYQTKASLCQKA